ncbi:hypothetical protein HER32_09535 [Hymenobacter sp. BT18]|uniref:hypothetical protein n=1 Tax=Hymenobacter sp. BT18 TaxID=2835648 RepID=UPI00143E780B|nr:hypothetical protein [Hymenobacter sp. BT18]QIX61406.1 hypothetical protein HER32_09535 [Hymenobacter sp. BT18]
MALSQIRLALAAGPNSAWYARAQQAQLFPLIVHVLLLVGVYAGLYCFGFVHHLPTADRLLSWDAGIYQRVAAAGYDDPTQGKSAFFPLYPYLWRVLHLGPVGMSLFLAGCALLGAAVLARTFRLTGRQTVLLVSAPAMVFTWVPYSEGLFYLWAALLLCGMHRRNLSLTLVALLLCCLTRAAATLFVPAYLFAELLTWNQGGTRKWLSLWGGLAYHGCRHGPRDAGLAHPNRRRPGFLSCAGAVGAYYAPARFSPA